MRYFVLILLCCLEMACHEEDNIHVETNKSRYVLTDGPIGSFDHYAYVLREQTGITIWKYPEIQDYVYNMDAPNPLSKVVYLSGNDAEALFMRGKEIFEEIYLRHYPQEFHCQYSPLLVFLVDSLLIEDGWNGDVLVEHYCARNYIALGSIEESMEWSKEMFNQLIANVNVDYWVNILTMNFPDWFPYEFNEKYPKESTYSYPYVEGGTPEERERLKAQATQDMYDLGLLNFTIQESSWQIRVSTSCRNSLWQANPELGAYLNLIFTSTPEELQAFLNAPGKEKVKERYELLREAVIDYFDYDLNEFNKTNYTINE